MKVILHIGMGKTGTTSIQHALPSNTDHLLAQNVQYLGRQFNVIDSAFKGFHGINSFVGCDPKAMKNNAKVLSDFMQRQYDAAGTDTFIFSNETLFAHPEKLKPFIDALEESHEVVLVVYVRDPADWLPSAYTQWGIRHKQRPGPITPFKIFGPKLLNRYEPILVWKKNHSESLIIRKFDKTKDVVQDFAQTINIDLPKQDKRQLVRAEPVETVLRGLFNNRFETSTLPNDFEKIILNTNNANPIPIRDMVDLCFDYSAQQAVLNKSKPLLDEIEQAIDIKFDAEKKPKPRTRYDKHIQLRVIDYLTEIVMQQGLRIQAAEDQIKTLSDKLDKIHD